MGEQSHLPPAPDQADRRKPATSTGRVRRPAPHCINPIASRCEVLCSSVAHGHSPPPPARSSRPSLPDRKDGSDMTRRVLADVTRRVARSPAHTNELREHDAAISDVQVGPRAPGRHRPGAVTWRARLRLLPLSPAAGEIAPTRTALRSAECVRVRSRLAGAPPRAPAVLALKSSCAIRSTSHLSVSAASSACQLRVGDLGGGGGGLEAVFRAEGGEGLDADALADDPVDHLDARHRSVHRRKRSRGEPWPLRELGNWSLQAPQVVTQSTRSHPGDAQLAHAVHLTSSAHRSS